MTNVYCLQACATPTQSFPPVVGAAWNERMERDERGSWERMRLLATICIQPHVKRRMKPVDLLRLPWDKKESKPKGAPIDKQTALRRFSEVAKKMGKGI